MSREKTPLRIQLENFFTDSLSDNKLILTFKTQDELSRIRSQVSNLKKNLQAAEKAVVTVDYENNTACIFKEPETDYVKPKLSRPKTPLRLQLEEFFNTSKSGEQLMLNYDTPRDLAVIKSTFCNLQKVSRTAAKAKFTVNKNLKQVCILYDN